MWTAYLKYLFSEWRTCQRFVLLLVLDPLYCWVNRDMLQCIDIKKPSTLIYKNTEDEINRDSEIVVVFSIVATVFHFIRLPWSTVWQRPLLLLIRILIRLQGGGRSNGDVRVISSWRLDPHERGEQEGIKLPIAVTCGVDYTFFDWRLVGIPLSTGNGNLWWLTAKNGIELASGGWPFSTGTGTGREQGW